MNKMLTQLKAFLQLERLLIVVLCLFASGILYERNLFAQQQPPPPRSSSSDIQSIGGQIKAFEKSPEVKIPKEKKEPSVEEPLPIEEGMEFPKKEVFIKQIEVAGNTVVSTREIQKITSQYENRKILLPELQQCTKAITTLYRRNGYVTSQAYIPPQKILSGKVRIQILEGRVGEVKVQGEKHFTAYGVRRLINLKRGQVLKVQKLENSLVRVNRNPDVTGRAVLAPSEEKGATDVVISVKDKFPMHAGYQFDNLGTKLTGRNRQNITLTHNNLLTLDDRLINRFVITEMSEFVGVSSSYVLPLDARGDNFNFNFNNVNLRLGKSLRELKIRSHAMTFSPSVTMPIFMTPHWEGDINSGFDFTKIVTDILGDKDSEDELRVLRLGPNVSEFDKWGRTVLTNQFSEGFCDFLGASNKKDKHSSRSLAGGQFFSWNMGMARFQQFFFDSVLILRGSAQATGFRLVSSEQFRIGGTETVRGYPEGDFLGDKGYTASVELRVPPYFIPRNYEIFGQKPRQSFQLVGFLDSGRGWNNNVQIGEIGNKFLMGVGGGIIADLFNHISARLYFAEAIGNAPSIDSHFQVHFILSSEF